MFEKIHIGRRILNLFTVKPNPSWENVIIVGIGIILNLLVTVAMGFEEITGLVMIVSVFVEMFMVSKIPIKRLSKLVLIFSLFTFLTFFTASISQGILILQILFFIFWFGVFVALQLSESPIANLGILNMFIYFFAATQLSDPQNILVGSLLCGVLGFFLVIISAIPMLLVRFLQKDPAKRELLAELFDSNITFHKFIRNRSILLKNDDSNPRLKSLINIAMNFFIAENNIRAIADSLDSEFLDNYSDFEKEIKRLLNKVKNAILLGYDYDFELNLGYIAEYQKELQYNLESLDKMTPKEKYMNVTVMKYKSMFEDLNLVLADKKYIDEMEIQPPVNKGITFKTNFSIKNNSLRYSLKFLIAAFASFIYDVFSHGAPLYATTLVSSFTLVPNTWNTKKMIYLRIISAVLGFIFSLIIIFAFDLAGLQHYLYIVGILAFLLFFVFEEDKHVSLIFLLMGIVLFLPHGDPYGTALEHLISSFVAAIIVLIVDTFLLPSIKKSNLNSLIAKKLDITDKFIHDTLVNKVDTYNSSKTITYNNYDIMNLINEIYSTYDNVIDDLYIFDEINDTLGQIRDIIIGIDTFVDAKKLNFDFSEFSKISSDFLSQMKYAIQEEEYVLDVYYNLEELEKIINNSDLALLKTSLQSLKNNFEYINDLIVQGEEKGIFDKYNQELF